MSSLSPSQASGALNRRLKGRLRKLIAINTETSARFKSLIDQAADPQLAYEFREWSLDRRANATELKELSRLGHDSDLESEGERWLTKLLHKYDKSKRRHTGSDRELVLLEQNEAIEQQMKCEYEDTLRISRGSPLMRILQSQYLGVKAVHDKTRRFIERRRAAELQPER